MRRFLLVVWLVFVSISGGSLAQGSPDQRTCFLSDRDKRTLMQYAFSVMDAHFGKSARPVVEPIVFSYDRVFVTLYQNGRIRGCQSGYQGGYQEMNAPGRIFPDLEDAVKRAITDRRFGGRLAGDDARNTDIVINILLNRSRVENRTFRDLQRNVELGVHAIEVSQGKRYAFFKESVPITKNYSLEKTLSKLCQKARIKQPFLRTEIYRYDVITFRGQRDGVTTDLYRYNLLVDMDEVSLTRIRDSVLLAERWFSNSVNPLTGRLEYMYLPSDDKYSAKNNHVRQLATLWAMSETELFLHSTELKDVITRGLDYYLRDLEASDDYLYLNIKGGGNIAYNAFFILTLVNTPDYPERERLVEKLAQGILNLQQEDGSLRTYFHSSKNSGIDYYPGEALLALMKVYRMTCDVRYMDVVKKAFTYYRSYWLRNKNTAFVPWHTQAYYLLYLENGDMELAEFVFLMNDWLIDRYQINDDVCPDKIGGFPKGMPRNATGVYLEGINDAYALAKLVEDSSHAGKYAESVRMGIRFVLQIQFTPENSFYLRSADKAIGGFKGSLVENNLRIDYTQHAVRALIKAYQQGIFKP